MPKPTASRTVSATGSWNFRMLLSFSRSLTTAALTSMVSFIIVKMQTSFGIFLSMNCLDVQHLFLQEDSVIPLTHWLKILCRRLQIWHCIKHSREIKRPDRITEGWAGTCSSDQIWGKTPLWRMRRRRWKTTVIWWTIRDHSRGKILSGCFQHHQYKKIRDQNPGCCSPRRSWTCWSCGNTRNWRTQVPCDPNGRRNWTERNPRTYRKWKSFWWRILWQYRYWDRGDIWWRIIVNSYFLTLTKPC